MWPCRRDLPRVGDAAQHRQTGSFPGEANGAWRRRPPAISCRYSPPGQGAVNAFRALRCDGKPCARSRPDVETELIAARQAAPGVDQDGFVSTLRKSRFCRARLAKPRQSALLHAQAQMANRPLFEKFCCCCGHASSFLTRGGEGQRHSHTMANWKKPSRKKMHIVCAVRQRYA